MRGLIGLRKKQEAVSKPALPPEIGEIRLRALKGHTLDQVLWGKILLDSIYVDRDPKGAFEWFTIAACAGYGPAHNMLGRCYHFGWGCDRNLQEAALSYGRAADLGDEWGRYNLGIMLMRGIGMERDMAGALACFMKAANAGHAKSMNLYARFLEEGWCVPIDRSAALRWYQRSADGGDYRGQHNFATALLEEGRTEQALSLWALAVETATPDILLAIRQALGNDRVPGAQAIVSRANERLAPLEAGTPADS